MDYGLSFLLGSAAVILAGALAYRLWYVSFYKHPRLSRTEVSLQIDEKIIYLPHVVSVTEEYVHSNFLMFAGFVLGFAWYLVFYRFLDLGGLGVTANMISSAVLTVMGGAVGTIASLGKKTVVRDSGGGVHVLHLHDVETIEFGQELTEDIWDFYKRIHKI